MGYLLGALGIGINLAKVRLLNNSANTFRAARYGLGSFFGFWFLIMTLLSMFAAAGFYALTVSTTQHEAAIATDAYQSASHRLETMKPRKYWSQKWPTRPLESVQTCHLIPGLSKR